ncbi:Enoyl-CoA hydratase OS=Castellaniella defragrans OX=75697 GN=HNR28_002552 PE=3 SV=1 [Castellaniella defragrans]
MSRPSATTAPPATNLVLRSTPSPRVLVLRLNRPEKANSLSKELVIELCEHLRQAQDDPDTGCVVLTGSDRIFSAGADISGMVTRGVDWYLDPDRLSHWHEIQEFPKPLIAAVEGPAIGGGCELTMLCDIIIAAETASFCQAEVNIGIMPGDGGTQRLPRFIGKSLAMQMILAGERISAARAERAGLVSEVVPTGQAVSRATELASVIAARAPISVQRAKRAALAAFERPLQDGLAFERQTVASLFETEDRLEGMNAFLEKRPPRYKGR